MKTLLFVVLMVLSVNAGAYDKIVPGIYKDNEDTLYSINMNGNTIIFIRYDFSKARFHAFVGVQDRHVFNIDSVTRFDITDSRYELRTFNDGKFIFVEQIYCKPVLPVIPCDYPDGKQVALKRVF